MDRISGAKSHGDVEASSAEAIEIRIRVVGAMRLPRVADRAASKTV
jgi:hypothetical protein